MPASNVKPLRAAPPAAAPAPDRDSALDGIRMLAMFMVAAVHVSAKGFYLQLGQPHWWAMNAYDSAARVAVPLFFMMSGALLLPRQHDIGSIGRRLWRVGLPLLAWSLLYLLWFRHTGAHTPGWLRAIVKAPVVGHLWYLYTLIGAYLFLPVMAGFYQASAVRVQVFCLLFWFAGASVVPMVRALTGTDYVGIDWSFLPLYAGYMVAGALLYWHVPVNRLRTWLAGAVWAACTVAVMLLTWWRCVSLGHPDETFYVYSAPPVLLGAMAAFICLRAALGALAQRHAWLARCFVAGSNVSFGVYLLHVLALFWFDALGYDYRFINPWLGVPLLTLFTVTSCALTVRALQAIPVLRLIVPR